MQEEQRIENIYREFFSNLAKADMIIATEMDILTVEHLRTFRKVFPSFEFADVSPLVLEQRKTKESVEIESIRRLVR